MVTLLGTTFSSDEKVIAQYDEVSIGSTKKTLVIQFDQTAYEEMLRTRGSTRSSSVQKAKKIRKVWIPKNQSILS